MSRKATVPSVKPQTDAGQGFDEASKVDRILTVGGHVTHPSTDLEKLRCMIELSSDYYWELDREFRVSQVWFGEADERQRAAKLLLGKTRWELGGEPIDGSWDDHKATLRAHLPFDGFIIEWAETDESIRYLKFSGRPRHDDDGEFLGYMGITQDVTNVILSQKLSSLEVALSDLLAGASYPDFLDEVMNVVCEGLGWTIGRCWRIGESVAALRLIGSTQITDRECVSSDETRTIQRIRKIDERLSDAIRSKKLIWCPGNSDSNEFDEDSEFANGVIVPVVQAGNVFAVLEFAAPMFHASRELLASFLSHLAGQISAARERSAATDRLKESERDFASTVELAAIGICHIGLDGSIIHVNQQMASILGYTRDELLLKTVKEVSHPDDRNVSDEYLARLLAKEIESFRIEKRYVRKDGRPVWVRINSVMKWDEYGNPLHHISIVEDISDRKAAEDKIEHLATHDALTSLPNRALFGELLNNAVLSRERTPDKLCAVLFVDLDRFKVINDTLGHQSGDALLRSAADIIRKNVRKTDCVARFGGDEFVALLIDLDSAEAAETIARKVLLALQKPIRLKNHGCRVTASIGIAVCPDDGDDPQLLLRNADIAMYAAKESGRNAVQRYSIDMATMSVKQITLETHLRLGLERQEFRIQYQPRVDARTGRIVGAEALLRWWNSELGTIPPVQFVPVAEDSGLIVPIGHWVLREACAQNADWQGQGLRPISVSVNLSLKQFCDPNLVAVVENALLEAGLSPEYLELEIAESTWIWDINQSIRVGNALRDLGVRLAIDDFGTGNSSLDQLQRLPLDTIKIDRSFVRDLPTSEEDRARTEAMIAMGSTLGVSTVAEGVESAEQYALLSRLQCEQLQGMYFGKSCHPQEMTRLLREGSSPSELSENASSSRAS